MEEKKINEYDIDLGLAPKSSIYAWFWQSDSDPWKEKDETKWTWTAYSNGICSRIEKALISKQYIVDLEDFEIDLIKMLQINKTDRNKIRRVKKEILCDLGSRFLTDFELPKPIQQDEKTINHAFGNVEHFLNYMMKRTPAAYKLYQRLKILGLDSQESQYKDIVEEVIKCIQKAAEQKEKIIKTRIQNPTQNFIVEAGKIVEQIRSVNSKPLRDFLEVILRLYTMESYLCYYLNELLRNEKWEELNVLTPYLVCLAYSFKIQDYVIKLPQERIKDHLISLFKKRRLVLYRGATLTEEHLKFYQSMKGKHFSWNAVSSTSRSRDIAMRFLNLSLKKAKELNEKKVGVIFRIKADFATSRDCIGMIDISGYSKYPAEQEVILAPGTVFELASIKCNKKNVYEMKLRIKKKFDNTEKKIPLLGTLQEKVILEDKAVLQNLSKDESVKALQLLKGNKLVRTLEITNCVIDDHLVKLIKEIKATTNMKPNGIRLSENRIVVPNMKTLVDYFPLDNIKHVLADNQVEFSQEDLNLLLSEKKAKKNKAFIKKEVLAKILKEGQLGEFFTRINYELEVEELVIETVEEAIKDNNFEFILETIKSIAALKRISMNFLDTSFSDQKLFMMQRCLISMVNLQSLSLLFKRCPKITNEGLEYLKDLIKILTSLESLSLDFEGCEQITDNGLNHLKDIIKITSLKNLTLDFRFCEQITDNGLNYLIDTLKVLTSLLYLDLSIKYCKQITDNALNYLKDSLKMLTLLQHLSLDFEGCEKITDNGLSSLRDALKMLPSLQHLSLNFEGCEQITDNGLYCLADPLKMLTLLQHLCLIFVVCKQISDNGINYLKDALKVLPSLQHLSLNFEFCKITDNGVNYLQDAIKTLRSLKHLSLVFIGCKQITDSGLNDLKDGIKLLTSLQHLKFDFFGCEQITDNGLNHLVDALSLVPLQYLALVFSGCEQITDNGLNYLKEAIQKLTSLQHVSLVFVGCKRISDVGLNYLKGSLKMLTSLQHLSLDFNFCIKISDNGLYSLKNTLIRVTSLGYLSINNEILDN